MTMIIIGNPGGKTFSIHETLDKPIEL